MVQSNLKLINLSLELLLDTESLTLGSLLGLIQSTLELLLLLLQHAALFVQSMDGAAALTKLVEQILDLISQVLVLTLDNMQLLHRLLLGGLQAEQLRGVVASL